MGFRMTWDKNTILWQVRKMGTEINSSYNDGYTAWTIKQDLYNIKFELDRILENSTTFGGEQEFLEQHEKQKVWQQLKKV
jgi:hypothetical protein